MASNCGRRILSGIWNLKLHANICIWIVCKQELQKLRHFQVIILDSFLHCLFFFFLLASLIQGTETPPPPPRRCIFLVLISCFPYGLVGIQFEAPGGAGICIEAKKGIRIHSSFSSAFVWSLKAWSYLFCERKNEIDFCNLGRLKDMTFLITTIHKHLLPSYQDVLCCYFNL